MSVFPRPAPCCEPRPAEVIADAEAIIAELEARKDAAVCRMVAPRAGEVKPTPEAVTAEWAAVDRQTRAVVDALTDTVTGTLAAQLGAVNDNLGSLLALQRANVAGGGGGSLLDRSSRQNF